MAHSGADPLADRFAALQARGLKALIPYITAGHPSLDSMATLLSAIANAGADIIEVGVPFSDPVADGPTIQRSSQAALDNGCTLEWTLGQVARFRQLHDTPVVLFTYLNPILRRGIDGFLTDARNAGAAGLLVTDLPVGVDENLERKIEASGLAQVRLVAPTTPPDRALEIARRARGFLYYISRSGVTGARAELRVELSLEVERLRAVSSVPVAVGFGISTPAQAADVARVADGVVVGSALIEAINRGGVEEAARFISGMRRAMDVAGATAPPA